MAAELWDAYDTQAALLVQGSGKQKRTEVKIDIR